MKTKQQNNCNNNITTSIKRKYNDSALKDDPSLDKILFIKNKIDDIYEKFIVSKVEWKEEFKFELKQENIVDISNNIPRSLNTRGSHLMELSKFWILFIELKFPDLDLNELIDVFNDALLYEQNDISLLYNYMKQLFENNFENHEIYSFLIKLNGNNHFRVPEKVEDLKTEHYKYLLKKPELFTINPNFIEKNNTPLQHKSVKSNTTNTKRFFHSAGSNLCLDVKKVFNPSSSIALNKNNMNSCLYPKPNPISMFSIVDSPSSAILENISEIVLPYLKKQHEISFQVIDFPVKIEDKQEVNNLLYDNTSIDWLGNCYKTIIDRNKFSLNVESVCFINITKESDENEQHNRNNTKNHKIKNKKKTAKSKAK